MSQAFPGISDIKLIRTDTTLDLVLIKYNLSVVLESTMVQCVSELSAIEVTIRGDLMGVMIYPSVRHEYYA